jgi:hypothetical protein
MPPARNSPALPRRSPVWVLYRRRFLRQVLFGERTIEEAADAWEKRVEQR